MNCVLDIEDGRTHLLVMLIKQLGSLVQIPTCTFLDLGLLKHSPSLVDTLKADRG